MENIEDLLGNCISLFQEGKLEEAEKMYKKILRIDPNNFNAIVNLGNIYGIIGMFDKAVEHLERALTFNPNNQELLTRLKAARKDLEEKKAGHLSIVKIKNSSQEVYLRCYD